MASSISSTHLPFILTAMTLLGHDYLLQEGHCLQIFMETMQACGSEGVNAMEPHLGLLLHEPTPVCIELGPFLRGGYRA